MKAISRAAMGAVIVSFLLFAGCTNGVLFNNGLYTHTVEPLTFNKEPTEMLSAGKKGRGGIEHIQYEVSVEVGTNGIGDVAKQHGIETVYYADIEKRSFVFGIWQERIIHVYGR